MLFALSALQHSQMGRKLHCKPTDKAISAVAENEGNAECNPKQSFHPRNLSSSCLVGAPLSPAQTNQDMADQSAIDLFEKHQMEFDLDPTVTTWLTSPDGLAAKNPDDLLCACTE